MGEHVIIDAYLFEGKHLAATNTGSCYKVSDPARNPCLPEKFYPSEPVVSPHEWLQTQDYYLYKAPQEWRRAVKVLHILLLENRKK